MESNQLQEDLLWENESLHRSYNLMKDLLVCYQEWAKSKMSMSDLWSSFKTAAQMCNYPPQSRSQVIEEQRRNNSELGIHNEKISRDLEKLMKAYNHLFSQRPCSTGAQTWRLWRDMEETSKLQLQEIEAWEEEKKDLEEEIIVLIKQKCMAKDCADDLKDKLEGVRLGHGSNERVLDELPEEISVLSKEKRESEGRAYYFQDRLYEAQTIQSVFEIHIKKLREEADALCESLRTVGERLQSKSAQPSGWRGVFRFFRPGQRRHCSNKKPFEPGE